MSTRKKSVRRSRAVPERAQRISVQLTYLTGIAEELFSNARLHGSWDGEGRYSTDWSNVPMQPVRGEDGCSAFTATVDFDPGQAGSVFQWGVELDGPAGSNVWGIMTEESQPDSRRRIRSFQLVSLPETLQHERYWLNHSRRLGAQKYYPQPAEPSDRPRVQFSLWAPNARSVEVCIGALWTQTNSGRSSLIDPAKPRGRMVTSAARETIAGGYIADDGTGVLHKPGPFAMERQPDGVWTTRRDDPDLTNFARFDHLPYMFRVTKDNGAIAYRTDLYSRCQIGFGQQRPAGTYLGTTADLDGSVSCSVVVDPDRVTEQFLEPVYPETRWVCQDEFFANPGEASPLASTQLNDLVIYELHLGALGASRRAAEQPGNLEDALAFLDHLEDLGVNALELLPLSEFGGGGAGWGYATSHYFAIEYAGGGRDQYKWFIRECHRRGIAVILDVVYNHYSHQAERAQWMFDTDDPARNPYYWYEGQPQNFSGPEANVPGQSADGGYVDNESTGWAPRYWEETVRQMFVSSALALATEFHIDGLRVDQTTSIHLYNRLHADGRQLPGVNAFGGKFLRELTRSLRFVQPRVMLTAEDHSGWDGVLQDPDRGGLGFDATWYADFYHHLIGDTDKGSEYAKLIKTAGLGDDRPLAMDAFAGALQATRGGNRIVYHESHDEAGNGALTDRTIRVAVNGAPLVGDTRRYAEARCRFSAGVTLLSAGIPMFLFGEEVGAEKKFLYGRVLENRENLQALREGSGRFLFEFYRQLIRLRRSHPGLRSPEIDVLFVHNEHRLLVFRRWGNGEDFLVIASLNNRPFSHPSYVLHAERIPGGQWREIFNSDSAAFGGDDIGNGGATLNVTPGSLECAVPANGFIVFQRSG